MANVADGNYRISIYGQQFVTAENSRVVLLPDNGGAEQVWQIRRTGSGDYTIRQNTADLHLGYEGEPDPFEPIQVLPERREWNITDGPEEGTVTIAAPGAPLTLGLSPLLIHPPMVALSPPDQRDRGWTLQPA